MLPLFGKYFASRSEEIQYHTEKKTLKKFFTRLLFVTSNRYKFQIKDKKSLLILKVQNIVFNVGKICVFLDFFEYPESGLSRLKFQQYSAIIFYVASSLVSFLCCLYIMVELLALFIANITDIFWRLIQVAVEKMHFDIHIDTKNSEMFKHVFFISL